MMMLPSKTVSAGRHEHMKTNWITFEVVAAVGNSYCVHDLYAEHYLPYGQVDNGQVPCN